MTRKFLFLLTALISSCSTYTHAANTSKKSPIEAVVTAADPEASTLTLEIKDTKGPLVAHVCPGDAKIGYVGQTIHGNLETTNSGPRLECVWPIFPRWVNDTASQLRRDTANRPQNPVRQPGEMFPPFAAIDQKGSLFSNDNFKGKWTMASFIFTRCQNPEMCPAVTKKMVTLEGILSQQNMQDVQLFVFTFDPIYDTPGIFRTYADSHGARETSYLHFLTGPKDAVRDLMKQMDIHLRGEGDHTMAFVLIDPTGRIVDRKEGNTWTPTDAMVTLKNKRSIEEKQLINASNSTDLNTSTIVPTNEKAHLPALQKETKAQ